MSERGDLRLGSYTAAVEARLARWQEEAFGRRLWEKDYTLWSPEPTPELTDRLGWLSLPNTMTAEVQRLSDADQQALKSRYLAALARTDAEDPGAINRADLIYAVGTTAVIQV